MRTVTPHIARRRLLPSLGLALCVGLGLGVALPGCGDGGTEDAGPTTGSATDASDDTGTAAATGRERVPVETRPTPVPLPDAPDLTDDSAQAELTSSFGDLAGEEASRASLLYLAELGDPTLADVVRRELLAREGDAYDDPLGAALGLEVLLAMGQKDVAPAAIELARWLIEEEEEVESIARALGHIDGAQAADAELLLVDLVESDYDDVSVAAIEALAARGSSAAESVLPGVAADVDRYDATRGSAVAAMLITGHERAATSADALLGSDADLSEVIAGFGIAGAAVTVPYMERIMDRAFDEGNADLEFVEACYALAAIFGGTADEKRGRDLIQGWLQRDTDLDGDEATYALFALGDTSRVDAAAALLAEEVAASSRHDPELAVDLLAVVARRGLARDPRFAKAVNAAAIAPERQNLPGLDISTQQLRAAAAHAYLRSR